MNETNITSEAIWNEENNAFEYYMLLCLPVAVLVAFAIVGIKVMCNNRSKKDVSSVFVPTRIVHKVAETLHAKHNEQATQPNEFEVILNDVSHSTVKTELPTPTEITSVNTTEVQVGMQPCHFDEVQINYTTSFALIEPQPVLDKLSNIHRQLNGYTNNDIQQLDSECAQ